jgi:hypothetical protein
MKLSHWKALRWTLLTTLLLAGAGCSGINANVPVSPAMFMLQNTHPPSPSGAMETPEATPLVAQAE